MWRVWFALVCLCSAQPSIPSWPNSIFYKDISAEVLDSQSAAIITNMKASSAAGSGAAQGLAWGSSSGNMQWDASLAPIWLRSGGRFACAAIVGPATTAAPDGCDDVTGLKFPLPTQGAIEGTTGYGACDGDCHLLVYDQARNQIFESYGSSVTGTGSSSVLTSSCVIVWDLTRDYPNNLRGDQCTSVDAAGFPIAPLLATADEVSAGTITHALRLALPNDMLQTGVYAHPATHASSVLRGANPSPFYGMRMRLKSSFVNANFANPSGANTTALNVFFNALKKYGMFMADGSSQGVGGIPFMVADDRLSGAKWAELGLDSHSFFGLKVDDFEVVQVLDSSSANGGRITLTFNCVRSSPNILAPNALSTCSAAPTCSDGLLNGDETAVDCGGSCPPCLTFQWLPDNFGACSVTCGGGLQVRQVNCINGSTGVAVDPSNCASLHPPDSTLSCNLDACPAYTWVTYPYGLCSAVCGGGTMYRAVRCLSNVGNVTVPDENCPGIAPLSSAMCNTDIACTAPRWVSGPWSLCSVSCGGSTQNRVNSCQDANGNVVTGGCQDQEPTRMQACNTQACRSYMWNPCETFYPCTAQCNGGSGMLGIKYRDVFCVDNISFTVVDPTLCDPSVQPSTAIHSCNPQPCSTPNWMATTNWGPCQPRSDLDPTFVRARTFHCHYTDGSNADPSICKAIPKPIAELPCVPDTCLVIPPVITSKAQSLSVACAIIWLLCMFFIVF